MSVLHRNRDARPIRPPHRPAGSSRPSRDVAFRPPAPHPHQRRLVRYLHRRGRFGRAHRLHAAEHPQRRGHLPVDARQRAAGPGPAHRRGRRGRPGHGGRRRPISQLRRLARRHRNKARRPEHGPTPSSLSTPTAAQPVRGRHRRRAGRTRHDAHRSRDRDGDLAVGAIDAATPDGAHRLPPHPARRRLVAPLHRPRRGAAGSRPGHRHTPGTGHPTGPQRRRLGRAPPPPRRGRAGPAAGLLHQPTHVPADRDVRRQRRPRRPACRPRRTPTPAPPTRRWCSRPPPATSSPPNTSSSPPRRVLTTPTTVPKMSGRPTADVSLPRADPPGRQAPQTRGPRQGKRNKALGGHDVRATHDRP